MMTLSNQAACARYRDVFKERVDDSTNTDWDIFDVLGDMEIRLLTERLEVLENTLYMAMEISAMYCRVESLYSTNWLTKYLH
jgi:hypothetical protein